jgi:hypothetical protein
VKKLTVKEFAAKLRQTYPGQLDDIDDLTLTLRWTKKYPASLKYLDKVDAAKVGIQWGADNVVNFVKKKVEKVKDKVQPTPQPQDSTQTKTDSNWLQGVTDVINQAKQKFGKDSTKPTTQQPAPPQEKKVAPAYSSTFKSKPCDENTYPWTRGCKNNKIGQMNQIYFGDRYGDIYGDDLYYRLESLGYFYKNGEKEGEISKAIYDGVLKDSLQENEFSHRKKIVKETVKNVLKQRFNKK